MFKPGDLVLINVNQPNRWYGLAEFIRIHPDYFFLGEVQCLNGEPGVHGKVISVHLSTLKKYLNV